MTLRCGGLVSANGPAAESAARTRVGDQLRTDECTVYVVGEVRTSGRYSRRPSRTRGHSAVGWSATRHAHLYRDIKTNNRIRM